MDSHKTDMPSQGRPSFHDLSEAFIDKRLVGVSIRKSAFYLGSFSAMMLLGGIVGTAMTNGSLGSAALLSVPAACLALAGWAKRGGLQDKILLENHSQAPEMKNRDQCWGTHRTIPAEEMSHLIHAPDAILKKLPYQMQAQILQSQCLFTLAALENTQQPNPTHLQAQTIRQALDTTQEYGPEDQIKQVNYFKTCRDQLLEHKQVRDCDQKARLGSAQKAANFSAMAGKASMAGVAALYLSQIANIQPATMPIAAFTIAAMFTGTVSFQLAKDSIGSKKFFQQTQKLLQKVKP